MKSSISLLILFVLLISAGTINAQYVSPYNSSGNLRSGYDKAAEEARNRAIKPYKPEAVSKPKIYTPPTQTAEEKAAEKRRWEREAQANIAAEEAKNRNEAAKEAELAARKEAFKKKVAKYDFVDWETKNWSEVFVKLKGKYGFINAIGDEIVPVIYDTVCSFSEGVSCVRLGNKWGYVNNIGKVILPLQYEFAASFNGGHAVVKLKGKYGSVDKTGAVIIPLIYENIKSPSYELYAAKLKGLWGFIDKNGVTKITFEYDSVLTKHEFIKPLSSYDLPLLPAAKVVKAGLRFSIDTTGAVIGKKTDINTGKIVLEKKQTGSFTDERDNKTYGTIKIGTQVWMSENLDVTHLNNGEKIEQAKSKRQWRKAGENEKPAWCYYNNDAENGKKYGKLYNYYAVANGLAPKGWHIPEKEEWDKLIRYLGGSVVGCNKLRSSASWGFKPSEEDECGFNGLPGGRRGYENEFNFMGSFGVWWALRDPKFVFKQTFELWFNWISSSSGTSEYGLSVRCIKDDEEAASSSDLNKKNN